MKKKKSYYIDETQHEQLNLLSSVMPGQPKVVNLVREGINMVCEKYFAEDYVKKALSDRAKKKGRVRLIRSVS